MPIDSLTVPSAEANSNMTSISEQPAVIIRSNVPMIKRQK